MMPEEVASLPDAQSPTQRFKESEASAKDVPKKKKKKNCQKLTQLEYSYMVYLTENSK